MKTRNGMRIISVFMTLLLVSAMAMPAMACEPETPCGSKSIAGDPIQLTGEERDKTLDMALKNSQVKELQKQLIADGFTQKDPETFTVPVEDGLRTEVLFVAIPFQEGESQEYKTIVYSHNLRTGQSTTVVIQGLLSSCIYSLLACLGTAICCVAVCAALVVPEPAEPWEAVACLGCLPLTVGVCGTAYDDCTAYYDL